MSKLTAKILPFLLTISCYLLFTIPSLAAEPGLNLINNIKSGDIVPNSGNINWVVYAPESPDQLRNINFDVDNVVVRIHSSWTDTGKLMLGLPRQQQQVATDWCQAVNTVTSKGKRVFVEPFNELEHDYERITPKGGIGLNAAILRANNFIAYLRPCLAQPTTVISPALDPQSADFPTTSQAFSNFDVISCHPYRNNTINNCTSGPLAGKQYLFTEIGVDKGGAKYDNCLFIQQFCQENFIQNLNNTSGLIAYFLFTFAPGNYDGFWQLTNPQVVSALKDQCTDDLILNCDSGIDASIDQIVQSVKNKPNPGKVDPVPDRGIDHGPLGPGNISFLQAAINIIKALFSRESSNQYPFNQKNTDQYIEDAFLQSGDLPNMVKIYQPPATITDQVNTLTFTDNINLLGIHDSTVNGYTSQEYRDTIDYAGSGWMFSVWGELYDFFDDNDVNGKQVVQRDFFNLQSGVSPRQTPYSLVSDDQVDDVLCQLAASADPSNPYFESNPDKRLFDEVLGYLSPNKEEDFIYNLPLGSQNPGPGIVDRTQTSHGNTPVPIRISTIFCTNSNLSTFLAKCSSKGFGSINSGVCSGTPDWLKQPALEGPIFRTFYPRLRQKVLILTQNASAKGFLERCQEQDLIECDSDNPTKRHTVYSSDFGDLDPDTRTHILDSSGAYSKLKGGTCYSCRSTIVFFPNLTQANQTIQQTGNMSTPYSSHQDLSDTPQVVDYSNVNKESQVYYADPKTPLGIGNKLEQINPENLTLSEKLRTFLSRAVKAGCHSVTIHDSEGNPISQNVCSGETKSKLETILYISPQAYQYINNSKNFYSYLTPYSVQTKLESSIKKASGGSDQFINYTESDPISGNNFGGLKSDQELAESQTPGSGRQFIDDSAKKVLFSPNQASAQKIQQLMFTPYSWQNLASQDSTQYDNPRPSGDSPPSADFNPNVLNYCDTIRQSAQTYNLEPSLIAALISIESGGNPDAKSNCGAIGLMQVMPNDPQKYGEEPCLSKFNPSIFASRPNSDQLLDADFNIQYGTKLLSGMIDYRKGLQAGLTHYGPTGYNGYANLVLSVQSQNPTACQ